MNSHPVLYAMVLLVVLFWSANYIVAKIALAHFPAVLFTGMRIVLAVVFIWPAFLWSRARHAAEGTWSKADATVFLLLGMFGVGANHTFFLMGLERTSVGHAAMIIGLSPLCVLPIAAMMKQERITPRRLAGILVALLGVALLNSLPAASKGAAKPTVLGDALIFLASLSFAAFTVLGKKIAERHSSVTVSTFAYLGGAIALAPFAFRQGAGFPFAEVGPAGWLCVFYMALFPSVLGYLMYFHALSHIPASRVAAFSYLQPVLATAMGAAFLGERITLPLAAGGSVIFAGVYLAERG